MHHTDPPLHNQASPKDLFQGGHSVLDSLGMVGQHVLMLQGSPGVCPVEPDCLTARSVEKMRLRWATRASPRHRAIAVEVKP